jgi:protein arginine kinase activator
MLCEKCNNSEALSHLTEISNDIQSELYFCIKCSKNMHINRQQNILFSVNSDNKSDNDVNIKCINCGLTTTELIYDGRPGCPSCYKYFQSFFRQFYEISKTKKYNGKKPANYVEISEDQNNISEINKNYFDSLDSNGKLENELKTAVLEERYEDAAIIRDKLKEVVLGE